MDLLAFLDELVCLPLIGENNLEGKQSWEHLAHQPCGRSIRPCMSSSGCRNADLQLRLRMQEL
jgi:hypothetical protein